jgi:hypothetical protein
MAAGLLAGCAASWVMQSFPKVQPVRQARGISSRSQRGSQGGARRKSSKQENQKRGQEQSDATVATAEAISRNIFQHELTQEEKQVAGPAVHYAYGSLLGALYGGTAELFPIVGAGFGLPFGFTLWLLGDEIAVPALGLGKGPTEVSPDVHADALASHFCYGITTDLLRRVLRHVL